MPRLGSGVPLVGRVDELRRLRAALARAERGRPCAVLLAGDAGVGKTRLVTELGEQAAEAGALVLVGRCLDLQDGGLPYLPFAEVVSSLAALAAGGEGDHADHADHADEAVVTAMRARPVLERLLPQGAPSPRGETVHPGHAEGIDGRLRGHAEQDVGQLQLFDAVLGVLTELAEHRPVVVAIEDLHWADGSTRNLLSFLVSRLRGQRLLVVGSYREEEVHRRHPLRASLAELVRLPAVERLELPSLPAAEATRLVRALAEQPLDDRAVAELAARSEGNPFFAEELVASSATGAELPAGLAEVLLARLERLTPDARRAVRAVAVASDEVSHAALAAVSGLGEAELDDALREVVQHHVLVVADGFYRFRHALLQEAVYADLLPGERTRMHAAYAQRIRTIPQGKGGHARLAYHSLRSKDLPAALEALVHAAHEAESLGAPGAALRHFEQALEIWDAVPERAQPENVDELELLLEASYFAGTSGQPERAIAYARSAVDLLGSLGDAVAPAGAAVALRRLAESLMTLDSSFDEAPAVIERAWELVADSDPSRARAWVLATRAQLLRGDLRLDEAWRSAEAAVADARAVGAAAPEASALATLGALADSADDPAEARRRLGEAAEKARAAGALDVEVRARYFLALSYEDRAELSSALALYRQAVRRAEETGMTWSWFGVASRMRVLDLEYVTGTWPQDDPLPATAVGSTAVGAVLGAARVHLLVARGCFADAERLVADLRAQRVTDVWIAVGAASAGVTLAYWQGEYRLAAERAREGLGWLDESYPWALAGIRIGALGLEACRAAVRVDARREPGTVDRAAEHGEVLLAHVRACAERGAPRTGTLGPEGQAWLLRAETAAAALRGDEEPARWAKVVEAFGYGATYDQAVCRLYHAESLLAAGESAAAATELGQAYALAARLGARPLHDAVRDLARRANVALPGAAPVRATVDLFTERERAVLELVARGLTNRQVGEQLYISDKTVSVHLSRVMAKLGASRRAEAVAIAYDRGLLDPRPAAG